MNQANSRGQQTTAQRVQLKPARSLEDTLTVHSVYYRKYTLHGSTKREKNYITYIHLHIWKT